MKMLVIQGSPHGAHGNTEVLVQAFLEGATETGATEVEIVYLKGKQIKHCLGCLTCWTRTPGICVHHDDMPELLLKLREAEVVVLATPLYYYMVSGLMKNFLDRTLPLEQPFMVVDRDRCHHPPRYANSMKQIVLISNCGFPEQSHFSGLKETFRVLAHGDNSELKGMVCCAGGAALEAKEIRGTFQWYLDAVKQAGVEVVQDGKISDATAAVLDRPLFSDPAAYTQRVNEHWLSMGIEKIEAESCLSS